MWLQLTVPSDRKEDGIMSKTMVNLRTLSIWGYVLAFGSLFGVATFGYSIHGPSGST